MHKVLYILKVPPPYTGAALMNKRVNDSKLLRKHFTVRSITMSYNKGVGEMGKIGLTKISIFFTVFLKLLHSLFFFRPNIVYFQISCFGTAFMRDSLLVLLMKLFRKKLIFHIRMRGFDKLMNRNSLKHQYYKLIFRNSHIISLSQLLNEDIRFVSNGKIHVVNNGIPITLKHTPVYKPKQVLNLLFFSNLLESKGIYDYLDAMYLLKKNNIIFKGLIAGAEADLDKGMLENLLLSKNLSNEIEYLGAVYDENKHKLLLQTNIIIFPTLNDAFPGVALDALQYGIPIISTNEGAVPDIIDDQKNGYIVSKNSPQEIFEKTLLFINNPNLIESFGQNGRKKFLKYYTFEFFENNMKNVFEKVLDGR